MFSARGCLHNRLLTLQVSRPPTPKARSATLSTHARPGSSTDVVYALSKVPSRPALSISWQLAQLRLEFPTSPASPFTNTLTPVDAPLFPKLSEAILWPRRSALVLHTRLVVQTQILALQIYQPAATDSSTTSLIATRREDLQTAVDLEESDDLYETVWVDGVPLHEKVVPDPFSDSELSDLEGGQGYHSYLHTSRSSSPRPL